jgi:hypothetical protein
MNHSLPLSDDDWKQVFSIRWGRESARLLHILRDGCFDSCKFRPGISWFPTRSRVGGINSSFKRKKLPYKIRGDGKIFNLRKTT